MTRIRKKWSKKADRWLPPLWRCEFRHDARYRPLGFGNTSYWAGEFSFRDVIIIVIIIIVTHALEEIDSGGAGLRGIMPQPQPRALTPPEAVLW